MNSLEKVIMLNEKTLLISDTIKKITGINENHILLKENNNFLTVTLPINTLQAIFEEFFNKE
jgi:hypothetical protein